MQELMDEMNDRIETLEGHIAYCERQRQIDLDQAAAHARKIEAEKKLLTQYRDALRRLSSIGLHADPIAVVRMPDTMTQVEADRISQALKTSGASITPTYPLPYRTQ